MFGRIEDLARELAFHGAPPELIDACRRAAAEEERHAANVGGLARRFGGIVTAPCVAPRTAKRSVEELALENAVEGQVRELFGAAQAMFRAARSTDEGVRAVQRELAREECGHAELSARIGGFLLAKFDAEARGRVTAAVARARRELRQELARSSSSPALMSVAGVPSRSEALAMFDALSASGAFEAAA